MKINSGVTGSGLHLTANPGSMFHLDSGSTSGKTQAQKRETLSQVDLAGTQEYFLSPGTPPAHSFLPPLSPCVQGPWSLTPPPFPGASQGWEKRGQSPACASANIFIWWPPSSGKGSPRPALLPPSGPHYFFPSLLCRETGHLALSTGGAFLIVSQGLSPSLPHTCEQAYAHSF